MANKYTERYSTLLIIREINQIPIKMAIIKKKKKELQTINGRKDVEKREHFWTVGENENWYSHYGEKYGDSLTN